MEYIIFNPNADNGKGKENVSSLITKNCINEENVLDITKINYADFCKCITSDDKVVICGGDGTLNRFVNDCDPLPECDILYYACGSGNDFLRDIGGKKFDEPISIKKYLVNLPTVTVNGKTYKFLNAVGFGIDGYCCEVGDKQRDEHPKKNINYAGIAIKGLLFFFSSRKARISVDGKEASFEHAWLCPTMHGRYYGGGMAPAPNQKRNEGYISLFCFNCRSRIKSLIIFPGIFSGKHLKHEKICKVYEGKSISVEFDKPTAIQIDGETILNVTKYTSNI